MKKPSVICIGAGPAGLTAAYMLSKEDVAVTVLERDPDYVGGISKTVRHKGFHVDIGGHRFFSKSPEIEALWTELLGPDLLERPRKSRILYRGKLFDYPLRATDALLKLGVIEASLCLLSYARARLLPIKHPRNFEEWVTNRFGRRLFLIFFKTYTEKVWGMKCTEISADWAAQRIKGLSLARAVWHALRPRHKRRAAPVMIKTLINSFRYPRRGPGMMWEAAADKVLAQGGSLRLGLNVSKLRFDKSNGSWTVIAHDQKGDQHDFTADHIISSMPIRDLIASIEPLPADEVGKAAARLRYRDFFVVALIIKERNAFDDNWIYVHDPAVKVGRIQNFKSWSQEMTPDSDLNCYGLEYFCFESDGLWHMADADLVDLARREIAEIKLIDESDVVEGYVIRQPKAYPVYDEEYEKHVETVRTALAQHYSGLHLVGRNGMHKYNNQDHAMMTAILTVRNILAGAELYDVWRVNQDAEYLEAEKGVACD